MPHNYSFRDVDRAAGLSSLPASGHEIALDELLLDIEFDNVVYQQYWATTSMLVKLRAMELIAQDVLDAINP